YRLPMIEAPSTATAATEIPSEGPGWLRIQKEITHAWCDDDTRSDAAHFRKCGIDECFQIFHIVAVLAEVDANAVGHVGHDAIHALVRHVSQSLDAVGVDEFVHRRSPVMSVISKLGSHEMIVRRTILSEVRQDFLG